MWWLNYHFVWVFVYSFFVRKLKAKLPAKSIFKGFGGNLWPVSRAEFPVSLSNHIGFKP